MSYRARLIDIAWLTLLIFLAAILHQRLFVYAYDDAYIHMRIARNLLRHGVPYYNLNQAVMGTSSPLWVLIVSGLFALFGESPKVIAWFNALIVPLACFFWTTFVRSLMPDIKPWRMGILSLALFGSIILSGTGLMESPLALLLAGLGLCSAQKHASLSMVWLTLSAATRPEFILLIPVGFWIAGQALGIFRAVVLTFFTALPFAFYLFYFYGTFIPHPVLAKQVVYQATLTEEIQLFLRGWFYLPPNNNGKVLLALWILLIIGSVLALLPYLFMPSASLGRTKAQHLVLMFSVLVFVGYLVGGTLIFPWYIPIIVAPIICAAATLPVTVFGSLLFALLSLPGLITLSMSLAALTNPVLHPEFTSAVRVRKYGEIGAMLRAKDPRQVVLASEIGALGFYYGGSIIDGVGLISPEALKFHPLKIPDERPSGLYGSLPLKLIEATRPDAIVSLDSFVGAFPDSALSAEYNKTEYSPFTLADEEAWQSYSLRHEDFWSRRKILLYSKKG